MPVLTQCPDNEGEAGQAPPRALHRPGGWAVGRGIHLDRRPGYEPSSRPTPPQVPGRMTSHWHRSSKKSGRRKVEKSRSLCLFLRWVHATTHTRTHTRTHTHTHVIRQPPPPPTHTSGTTKTDVHKTFIGCFELQGASGRGGRSQTTQGKAHHPHTSAHVIPSDACSGPTATWVRPSRPPPSTSTFGVPSHGHY
jgi:hypothetical protein